LNSENSSLPLRKPDHRIIGMAFLPRQEDLVGIGEVEVIK